ncbi:MAG: thiamine pyrophosphate-binding protein [Treponema sp.]|nr:thiamine pyrophosphate-binding protein [Treponema sp.]
MQVAEAIVHILEKEGIQHAFGIPGAGINPVYKFMANSKIEHFLMRHEEAAVHAADGYYRASGKMALAICTSGPGATNFVTGMYTAWQDSIPLVAITGQANSSLLGKGAFQCVDIAEICRTVAKKTWCVTKAGDIPSVFQEAFQTARSGRPGPVLIDLPLDIQLTEIDFNPGAYEPKTTKAPLPSKDSIAKALDLITKAKNPVILMGGGVILARAEEALLSLAEYLDLPVLSTYMAKGGIPEAHPLNAGMVGIQVGAVSSGNEVFLAADLVLAIGCRFSDRHTGNLGVYQGERRFIHIDIDETEIGKIIKPELGIVADAADALALLLETAKAGAPAKTGSPHRDYQKTRTSMIRKPDPAKQLMDPREVFEAINLAFNDETQFTTGCGITQIWSGQYQRINKPRKYLPSGGAGTLGFDIPAAIGASVATGKQSVCLIGDFGFTFLVEELGVAAAYKLPVVVLIINNAYLGLIRQNQKYALQYEYQVAMPENKALMDYVKISEGFACQAERVFSYSELEGALKRAAASPGPYVIDIICDENTDCDMGPDIANIRHFV